MPGIVLIGTQWGDEGKGKVTHLTAHQMDLVVRYQGGNNAGHTVMVGGETFKLHLLPAGVLYSHITCVIAPGVVVDPKVLLDEADALRARGIEIDPKRLRLSGNAHLIMPYHRELDRLTERRLGRNSLGTTRRGIGPAYADKASRIGIRIQDLLDPKILREKLDVVVREKNLLLTKVYGRLAMDANQIFDEYVEYGERLRENIDDTVLVVHQALKEGRNVLFEGAQGTLLDLDHGTYPFVTSSSPISGGACTGAGIGPFDIDRIIGVTKSYVTRVGAGPFPSEDFGAQGLMLRDRGKEYGTTTGRPRRCGWFDAVVVRYAARLNSLSEIFLTKLDVLSAFDSVKICVAYKYEGRRYEEFPPHQTIFHKAEPEFIELPGWGSEIGTARVLDDLPSKARRYIEKLQELAGVPITRISVGAETVDTVEAPGGV